MDNPNDAVSSPREPWSFNCGYPAFLLAAIRNLVRWRFFTKRRRIPLRYLLGQQL